MKSTGPPAEDPADDVAGPGTGAAGGHDQVGAERLVVQQRAQALRVVVADTDAVPVRAGLRRRRGQRVRVDVNDLAGLAGPADVDQLVAGGHDHDPGARPDHHGADAGGGEHRD